MKGPNSCTITSDKTAIFFTCPVGRCTDDPDAVIPRFSSIKAAEDAGWIKYADRRICPPDQEFVMVCPTCAVRLRK